MRGRDVAEAFRHNAASLIDFDQALSKERRQQRWNTKVNRAIKTIKEVNRWLLDNGIYCCQEPFQSAVENLRRAKHYFTKSKLAESLLSLKKGIRHVQSAMILWPNRAGQGERQEMSRQMYSSLMIDFEELLTFYDYLAVASS